MTSTSSTNPWIQRFLEGNAKFQPTWKNPISMKDLRGYSPPDQGGLLVLTCIDPRCEPTQFLGPNHFGATIKNAGGHATPDAVRSILTLRSLVTSTSHKGTVAVVHHTDCGMTHLTDEGILADIRKRTPNEAAVAAAEKIDFGCFTADEFEDAIRKDVQILRDEKLLEGMEILGLAFDTDTGLLKVV